MTAPISEPTIWEAPTIALDSSMVFDFSSRFFSFHDLITKLDELIPPLKPHTTHSEEQIQAVIDFLRPLHFNVDEWQQYVTYPESYAPRPPPQDTPSSLPSSLCSGSTPIPRSYTRNLVGYCTKFTILVLVWGPQQESPIHDHAGSSCWVKILRGKLQEVLYAPPPSLTERFMRAGSAENPSASNPSPPRPTPPKAPLVELSNTIVETGGVTYINDLRGIHKMINPQPHDVAVSLHIYAPMYPSCRIYTLDGASKVATMLVASAPFGAPRLSLRPPPRRGEGERTDSGTASTPGSTTPSHVPPPAPGEDVGAWWSRVSASSAVDICDPSWNAGPDSESKDFTESAQTHPPDTPHTPTHPSSLMRVGDGHPPADATSLHALCLRLAELTERCAQAANPSSSSSGDLPNCLPDLPKECTKTICDLVSRVALTDLERQSYVVFDRFRYTRNLVWSNNLFSVLIMGWAPGQYVPPHTHSKHLAFISVLAGRMRFDCLEPDPFHTSVHSAPQAALPESLRLVSSTILTPTSPTLVDKGTTIHRFGNVSNTEAAVSLHVYTPPYLDLSILTLGADGVEWHTIPVVVHPPPPLNFPAGVKHQETSAACESESSAHTPPSQPHEPSANAAHKLPSNSSRSPHPSLQHTTAPSQSLSSTAHTLLSTLHPHPGASCPVPRVFVNFDTMVQILDRVFSTDADRHARTSPRAECADNRDVPRMLTYPSPSVIDAVRKILIAAQFNRLEYRFHARFSPKHPTHIVLWTSERYTLFLSCWEPGQSSPPTRYPLSCMWIKTLEGGGIHTLLAPKKEVSETDNKSMNTMSSNTSSLFAGPPDAFEKYCEFEVGPGSVLWLGKMQPFQFFNGPLPSVHPHST